MTSPDSIAPAGVEFRRLTVDDLDVFRDIRGEALQKFPQSFYSAEEDQGGDAAAVAYRQWLSGTIMGAFACQNLVGIAGFHVFSDRRAQHRGRIYAVYVREASRGKGVGDRLIKELLALAAEEVEQVHLDVLITATDAIRTYKRNGFEIYGTDPGAVRIGESTYDKYLMMKKVR